MHAAYVISMTGAHAIHDIFHKGNKNLVPRALLSYISTWDFLRTLENCEKHLPVAHASLGHFSCVLKKSCMLI